MGIILAELFGRAPPFASEDHMRMLRRIVHALGSPTEVELSMVEDERAVLTLTLTPSFTLTLTRWSLA